MDIPCNNPCNTCVPRVSGDGAARLGLSPVDPANPYVNLSSEAPDVDLFIGDLPPWGTYLPPVGSIWYSTGCFGLCVSTISQADANLCAIQQAMLCVSENWPIVDPNIPINPSDPPSPTSERPPPTLPRPLFSNTQQSCEFQCADGNTFSFTVPAGVFFAFNQPTANALAGNYACQQAALNRICLGAFSVPASCINQSFETSVTASTVRTPVTFEVIAGALPPGLVESQSVNTLTYILSGLPNVAGDYSFVLRITDSNGSVFQKEYTITIFQISDASPLPDAPLDDVYSFTFTTVGTLTDPVFSIASGALPPGLSLNPETGAITGTATEEGDYSFVLAVTSGSFQCVKAFDLSVGSSACAIFDGIDWSGISFFNDCTGTLVGGDIQLRAVGPGLGMGTAGAQGIGTMLYTGAGVECSIDVVELTGGGAAFFGIKQDGNYILEWDNNSGTGLFSFTIAAGVDSVLEFTGTSGSGDIIISAPDEESQSVHIVIGT